MSMTEFATLQKMNAHSKSLPLQVTYGELLAYDPATGTGQFEMPLHRQTDSTNTTSQTGVPTGFIQCGTMFSGPGYGQQFQPPVGAQALIIFVDIGRMLPIAAVFLFNDVETPPFTDGKSNGWLDSNSQFVKTTKDGKTANDGEGGVRLGANYASIVAALIELGEEGLADGNEVVRKQDLQAAINNLENYINAHTHSGVESGGADSGPPVTSYSDTAEASSVVKAQ